MADVSREANLRMAIGPYPIRTRLPYHRIPCGYLHPPQHLPGNRSAVWARRTTSISLDDGATVSPGPRTRRNLAHQRFRGSPVSLSMASPGLRLRLKRQLRCDELPVRQRTPFHRSRHSRRPESSKHSCLQLLKTKKSRPVFQVAVPSPSSPDPARYTSPPAMDSAFS